MFKKIAKKEKLVLIGLLIIISSAFFLRAYNFDSWLYFKMDQARDALLISNALENGPEHLPLLGPRAGATEVDNGYLRLGPAYYYMQYVAGVLSGGNLPSSNAYPDLFFSIAVLPLLYLFMRLYFSRFNSLLVTAMYAFSFLVVQYSRFAWNPNTLPFFVILSFYGLLRFFSEQEVKKARLWIALWALGLGVGAQLHFFGFFSLVGISGLMFLWHFEFWNKDKLKELFDKKKMKAFGMFAGIASAVFLFVSAPMIISDFYKGGENIGNFVQALSTKAEKKPLADKLEKNVEESFKYYCLLTTSYCYNGDGFEKENEKFSAATMIILFLGVVYALWILASKKEKSADKKNFLVLLLAWIAVFFVLSVPVAFQLRPRFFIVVFAVPFILLGLIFKFLQIRFGRKGIMASAILAALVIWMNLGGIAVWFEEQKLSQLKNTDIDRTLILKAKDGVTLGQLQKSVDWMLERHKNDMAMYYYVKPEHVAPVKFLLYNKGGGELNFTTIGKSAIKNAQFFAIVPTGSELQAFKNKFGNDFEVLGSFQAGQISVYEVRMNNLETQKKEMFFNRDKGDSDRVFWYDVFGIEKSKDALEIEGAE